MNPCSDDQFPLAKPEVDHDDSRLVNFLQCYCPEPPPPDSKLEERIMAAVKTGSLPLTRSRQHARWAIPVTIAASLVAALTLPRLWISQPSVEQLANLESELETAWNDALTSPSLEENYRFLPDSTE